MSCDPQIENPSFILYPYIFPKSLSIWYSSSHVFICYLSSLTYIIHYFFSHPLLHIICSLFSYHFTLSYIILSSLLPTTPSLNLCHILLLTPQYPSFLSLDIPSTVLSITPPPYPTSSLPPYLPLSLPFIPYQLPSLFTIISLFFSHHTFIFTLHFFLLSHVISFSLLFSPLFHLIFSSLVFIILPP